MQMCRNCFSAFVEYCSYKGLTHKTQHLFFAQLLMLNIVLIKD